MNTACDQVCLKLQLSVLRKQWTSKNNKKGVSKNLNKHTLQVSPHCFLLPSLHSSLPATLGCFSTISTAAAHSLSLHNGTHCAVGKEGAADAWAQLTLGSQSSRLLLVVSDQERCILANGCKTAGRSQRSFLFQIICHIHLYSTECFPMPKQIEYNLLAQHQATSSLLQQTKRFLTLQCNFEDLNVVSDHHWTCRMCDRVPLCNNRSRIGLNMTS